MIGTHPSFQQPPNTSVKLWRYMDLAKFIAMLNDCCLFFARADNLGDPFEGSITLLQVSQMEEIVASKKNGLPTPHPYSEIPLATVEMIAEKMSSWRRQMLQESFVSCWHMNEVESAAMWKLYAQSGDAVCIQTTYDKLARALPEWSHMGVVEYIDYKTGNFDLGNGFNALLRKRRSFEHKHEARAVVWADDSGMPYDDEIRAGVTGGGLRVSVDLTIIIDEIYVSPYASPWFANVVESVACKFDLHKPVKQSGLLDLPIF